MGNSQSHTYADHQRSIWMRKSTSTAQRPRTRSLVDEYLPDFRHSPKPTPMQHQVVGSSIPRSNGNAQNGSSTAPDARFMSAPMPPTMTHTLAQAEALKAVRKQRPNPVSPLVPPLDRSTQRHSMPPSLDDSNGAHVHFQGASEHEDHDHSHDRPRTPYPDLVSHAVGK
ncbi:hypothetical protein ACLMJK_005701 [Lecanora helva]